MTNFKYSERHAAARKYQRGRFILVNPLKSSDEASSQTAVNNDIVWHSSMACLGPLVGCMFALLGFLASPLLNGLGATNWTASEMSIGFGLLGFFIGALVARFLDHQRSKRTVS